MRTALRALGWLAAVVLIAALGGVVFLAVAFPKKEPPPDVVVEGTPELVERGRYLFRHVANCLTCHSERDTTVVGEPMVAGTEGKENLAFGDAFFAPNITPAAMGEWSDGEIVRAIASGIRADGSALFPAMPYTAYRHMAMEDLAAIVAYMRTLEPIPVERARDNLPLPLNVIARLSPRPADPPARSPSGGVERGEYLATIAACVFCHTPRDRHAPVEEMVLAGGHEFVEGEWIVRAANLTPDDRTGIGRWSRERFIDRFRASATHPEDPRPRDESDPPRVMPWIEYAGMTEKDLGAIYDYLRTVEPIDHEIRTFERVPREEE